jgi:hypothetical protein
MRTPIDPTAADAAKSMPDWLYALEAAFEEDLQRKEAREDFWWGLSIVIGCAALLGAAWLS